MTQLPLHYAVDVTLLLISHASVPYSPHNYGLYVPKDLLGFILRYYISKTSPGYFFRVNWCSNLEFIRVFLFLKYKKDVMM